jgi:hypothetical protein
LGILTLADPKVNATLGSSAHDFFVLRGSPAVTHE